MPRRWRKKENILRMCFEGSCSEKKGILFCAVARKGIVVARCASCVGNFSQITNSLLDKVAESDLTKEKTKMTLTQADLLFHYVSSSCNLVALAITELNYDRATAFAFLYSVMENFLNFFNDQIQAARAFDMDNQLSHIIGKEIERYSGRGQNSTP